MCIKLWLSSQANWRLDIYYKLIWHNLKWARSQERFIKEERQKCGLEGNAVSREANYRPRAFSGLPQLHN